MVAEYRLKHNPNPDLEAHPWLNLLNVGLISSTYRMLVCCAFDASAEWLRHLAMLGLLVEYLATQGSRARNKGCPEHHNRNCPHAKRAWINFNILPALAASYP
jgi:hypothetical protein